MQLLNGLTLPEGFVASVFAAPPQLGYPTGVCVAPNGDVFVAVDENGSLDTKPERGRIVRLRDTYGDGRADNLQTFAKVDSPRGLVHDGHTLYVMAPPDLHAFRDLDGDGVAEDHQTLVRGLGFDLKFRGADHTTNQVAYGYDGKLYIAVGDYGFIKAVDAGGRELQMRGGGVVRVNPDGTKLEIVSRGQRNIYDVAVSPRGDLFTRDNTNDGGGWNVRLTHVVPGAQCGYPSLFTNFAEETHPALADYGPGSPCGALFMDEPKLPGEIGRTLITLDWGRSTVYRHPLKPDGATFTAEQHELFKLPRPVDMDYDGAGSFYVASWRDGGFSYSHPFVGYVLKIRHQGEQYTAPVDPASLTTKELIAALSTDSHRARITAQWELRHRLFAAAATATLAKAADKQPAGEAMMMNNVEKVKLLQQLTDLLFDRNAPLTARIGVLPLLAEDWKNANEQEIIDLTARFETETLANRDPLCEYLPSLLAQPPFHLSAAIIPLYKQLLTADDPRVRAAAVHAAPAIAQSPLLLRLLANRLGDSDRTVAHITERSWLRLINLPTALTGVEHPQNLCATNNELNRVVLGTLGHALTAEEPAVFAAATRILSQWAHRDVPAEFEAALRGKSLPTERRITLLTGLCRLALRDKPWDGKWWGTRPDTTGPYYGSETWSETARIRTVLQSELSTLDAGGKKQLIRQLLRHKLDFSEVDRLVNELAAEDADFRRQMTPIFAASNKQSPDRMEFLRLTADDTAADEALRALAIQALCKPLHDHPSYQAGFNALLNAMRAGPLPKNLQRQADLLMRDAKNRGMLAFIIKESATEDRLKREFLYSMLLSAAEDDRLSPERREQINMALTEAWKKPETAVDLLQAAVRAKCDLINQQIRERMSDADPLIAAAAKTAAKELRIDNQPTGPKIETLPADQIAAAVTAAKADVARGEQLFSKLQCVNCHTIDKNETPKGPQLAGITKRYSRDELLESILQPSKKIAQGFETQWFQTDDGLVVEGFVTKESAVEVELRNSQGQTVRVSKEHVEERGKREISIMPQGLFDKQTPADLASLLKFLETLK